MDLYTIVGKQHHWLKKQSRRNVCRRHSPWEQAKRPNRVGSSQEVERTVTDMEKGHNNLSQVEKGNDIQVEKCNDILSQEYDGSLESPANSSRHDSREY